MEGGAAAVHINKTDFEVALRNTGQGERHLKVENQESKQVPMAFQIESCNEKYQIDGEFKLNG